jgi:hypothetical protein
MITCSLLLFKLLKFDLFVLFFFSAKIKEQEGVIFGLRMALRLKDTELNKNHKDQIESLNNELRLKNDELELSRIKEKTHKEVVESLLLRICDLNCKLCQKKKHKQNRYQIKTRKQREN